MGEVGGGARQGEQGGRCTSKGNRSRGSMGSMEAISMITLTVRDCREDDMRICFYMEEEKNDTYMTQEFTDTLYFHTLIFMFQLISYFLHSPSSDFRYTCWSLSNVVITFMHLIETDDRNASTITTRA